MCVEGGGGRGSGRCGEGEGMKGEVLMIFMEIVFPASLLLLLFTLSEEKMEHKNHCYHGNKDTISVNNRECHQVISVK